MKALLKNKAKPGLWLEEVPKPAVGINDVLIRVHRTGICGTDLHIYKWDDWARKTIPVPLVVGHEFVGRIVEVGSNAHDFPPGAMASGAGAPATWSAAKATPSAASAAIAWPAVATCARTPRASVSTARGPSPNSLPCR